MNRPTSITFFENSVIWLAVFVRRHNSVFKPRVSDLVYYAITSLIYFHCILTPVVYVNFTLILLFKPELTEVFS